VRGAPPPDDEVETSLRKADVDRAEQVGEYTLTVAEGPARGACVDLDGARAAKVLVGSSPVCDLVLDDREVSRRHASLHVGDDGVRLRDLESTNGTRVNGIRVVEALLSGGELVEIGGSALRLASRGSKRVALPESTGFGRMVGASPAMRRLYPLLERVATTDIPVLLEGETGTGKEVLAESVHESGHRAGGPFVVFDCTAVPPGLVESELFGHERGAFTGAVGARKGVFEQADGGTLFIDELGELEPALQPKLLRALERSEVRRVGGDRWVKVDVRVIAATRRDLDREVQEGRFRDDLYFRLAVARVDLPPLRERRGDIAVLARHFWRELGGAPSEQLPYPVLQRFERHHWPGNVRELRNAVARQLALGDIDAAATADPPASDHDPMAAILDRDLPFSRARQLVQAEFERRYLSRVLARHGGSVQLAAQASGIARRYFNLILARQRRRDG
jgi:transcriptional regulator with GAF, ATPase, and Fis domain